MEKANYLAFFLQRVAKPQELAQQSLLCKVSAVTNHTEKANRLAFSDKEC